MEATREFLENSTIHGLHHIASAEVMNLTFGDPLYMFKEHIFEKQIVEEMQKSILMNQPFILSYLNPYPDQSLQVCLGCGSLLKFCHRRFADRQILFGLATVPCGHLDNNLSN